MLFATLYILWYKQGQCFIHHSVHTVVHTRTVFYPPLCTYCGTYKDSVLSPTLYKLWYIQGQCFIPHSVQTVVHTKCSVIHLSVHTVLHTRTVFYPPLCTYCVTYKDSVLSTTLYILWYIQEQCFIHHSVHTVVHTRTVFYPPLCTN